MIRKAVEQAWREMLIMATGLKINTYCTDKLLGTAVCSAPNKPTSFQKLLKRKQDVYFQ